MKIDNPPLVLIHYGDSEYLPYTLKNAIKVNSDTNVILIGDIHNKKYERLGLNHFYFDDFIEIDYVNEFDSYYRFVGGSEALSINERKRNVGTDYTRYNFLKWRVLYNFCKQNSINRLWTFDTDVLYCKPLS